MTYLEAVNNVLRRLREDEVADVTDNTYSKLIGDFVNDAYTIVESSWEWSGLEADITVTTVSGTQTYELDGAGELATITDVYDTTTPSTVLEVSSSWMRSQEHLTTTANAQPRYWAVDGVGATDRDPKIELWPIPDGVYSINVRVDKSGSTLSVGSTELVLPAQPVVQLAFGMALRERGEAGGQTAQEQLSIANVFLADAIARDAKRRPEKLCWGAV